MYELASKRHVFKALGPLKSRDTLVAHALDTLSLDGALAREALGAQPPPRFKSSLEVDICDPFDQRPLTAHSNLKGRFVICQRPPERIAPQDTAWREYYTALNQFEASVAEARAATQELQFRGFPDAELHPTCLHALEIAPLTLSTPERLGKLFRTLLELMPRALSSSPDPFDSFKPTICRVQLTPNELPIGEELAVAFQRAGYFAGLTLHTEAGHDVMAEARRRAPEDVPVHHARLVVFEL